MGGLYYVYTNFFTWAGLVASPKGELDGSFNRFASIANGTILRVRIFDTCHRILRCTVRG